jgi:glycerophosphoryl diester phosphodiesterase
MPDRGPLIIASACGDGRWPPNTVESCRNCLATPIDGVEIDVQLSADGQVVVHHDFRLNADRTRLYGEWISRPGALIKHLSLEELRRFDVGMTRPESGEARRYPDRQPIDGARIPTLPQIIDALKAHTESDLALIVEIKTTPEKPEQSADPAEITRRVIEDLEAANFVERARIIAFDWRVLRLARQARPEIQTAHLNVPKILETRVKLLASGDSPWVDGHDPRHHGGSVPSAIAAAGGSQWSAYFADLTTDNVAEARTLGLSVAAWGLDETVDIRRMLALGVASVTVSRPDAAGAARFAQH